MPYTSNVPQILPRLTAAIDAGLLAAVEIPMEKTRDDLAKGFTSGVFTSGESAASVERTDVYATPEGHAIAYGTDLIYHLWWALGAYSAWTRRFERVDKWTPHFYGSRDPMLAAFKSAYARVMAG